jgi:hypothetical protein
MAARKKTLSLSWLSRLVLAAACSALPLAATARAEQVLAYSLQISNSYIGLPGSSGGTTGGFGGGFGGGSVLEQLIDESRPFVRITNTSSNPALNLFGAELDLTNSSSMVTACEWVEGLGAPAQTWNWNADLSSAFFQFRTPLAPGESVLMRLSTAPRPGLEDSYTQNQQLFHPVVEGCLCSDDNWGQIDVFNQLFGSTVPVEFQPSGKPTAPDLVTYTTTFDTPLRLAEINDPSAIVDVPVAITPVPEPSTVVLAASAVAMLAVASRRRGRRARLAA